MNANNDALLDRLHAEASNYGLHEDVRALLADAASALSEPVGDALVTRALDGVLPNGHRVWAYVACSNPDPNVTGREVMRAALESIAGAQP